MNTTLSFALLCTLMLSNVILLGSAQPAHPESLEAELAAIDAMPDHKIVCMVAPTQEDISRQCLIEAKEKLEEVSSLIAPLANAEAKRSRLIHKRWAIAKKLESCNDHARKQNLQNQINELLVQHHARNQAINKHLQSLVANGTMPVDAYNYMAARYLVAANQAALFLAQKKKLEQKLHQEKIHLQSKKNQWQQEKQTLLAQLKGYQLLDGPQIEGAPGGIRPEGVIKLAKVRRGSF